MSLSRFIEEITAPVFPEECLPWIQYRQTDPMTMEKVKHLLHEIEKAKDRGQTNMALYYVYQIGKEIEKETNYKTRKNCRQKLTAHYRTLTKRVCCLFDNDRVSLIFHCKTLTPTTIRHMSSSNYTKLLEAAEGATAIRILEKENGQIMLQEDC
ncbi:MAG: hypothetical protein JO131_02100 [Gammaproteobacteria bacterium]|nr:hypothetical protein [Gammaproteobacteria bacterium]